MKQKDVDKIDKKITKDYFIPIVVSIVTTLLFNALLILLTI